MYKKLVVTMLYVSSAAYGAATTTQAADGNSGKEKIESIMSHAETGVAAYNRNNVHCAQTRNLVQDLNISEVGHFFGCQTIIGNSFIAETLKNPVHPQDKDSVLAHRQHAIKVLVDNPAVREEIGRLLEEARDAEQEVMIFLSDFFKGKICPELKDLGSVEFLT